MRRRAFLALASAAGLPFADRDRNRTGHGWLLIDFDSIFCGACFASVPDLLQALPEAVQERALTAVLVFSDGLGAGPGGGRRRLVEAKWNGLCRVHGWMLPAVLEPGPGFRPLLGGRPSRLILFDFRARTAAAYDPPLPREDLDRVLSLLVQ